VELLPSVVLVDSPEFETEDDQLTEYVRKQTAGAEIVCMGKTWMDSDEHANAVKELIGKLNSEAKIVDYPENDDEDFPAELLG
jgi:G3E family GTPase